MSAPQDFLDSLYDSEAAFTDAIYREEKSGFDDFEATLDRKYEEGFIDGMRHAYTLLTGDTLLGDSPSEFEQASRENARVELASVNVVCEHFRYSTSPFSCTEHPDKDCYENKCDNCSSTVSHSH